MKSSNTSPATAIRGGNNQNKKPSCRQDSRPYCLTVDYSMHCRTRQSNSNGKSKPLTKFEVSISNSWKICSLVCHNLQGSRDLGHAHFQGKFVRPLGIPYTKLCTKFEVASSSSFGDIDAAMVGMTLNDLNIGQGHSFWYQSISYIRLPIGCQQ